ncbi:phosphocholine cytidylyltransferase family protein [Thalassobaculum sp. OXR-137]|nr:phosphocholine cytidylyltransferase family protein [Thalassobaculum sp. OXR-137]WPZ36192.1 phosphocholine cytidylyltransferase family protein [Thalassobaculum sp. OXR-137]
MESLTELRPKCLVPIAGKRLIEWQRDALQAAGVSPVAAVGGYRSDLLTPFLPVPFVNERWAETNMVASLAVARDWMSATDVIVSYSDIAYAVEWVTRLIDAPPAPITIAFDRKWWDLWSLRFEDPLSDAETFRIDASGRLLEIGGKTEDSGAIEGQYMGLLRFSSEGWAAVEELLADLHDIPDRDRLDMTGMLSRLIARGVEIATVPVDGRWAEVDQRVDLEAYEAALLANEAKGTTWSHDWRG